MYKKAFLLLLNISIFSTLMAQQDSASWQSDFNKAKAEMRQLAGQDGADYVKTGRTLESLAIANPGNAEVWYFLGNAIDKFNTGSGDKIPSSSLPLAEKASECFVNANELSNGHYTGDILLLDPHSKILSVWGAQAFRYLNLQNKDSAIWCLKQAEKYGGINGTVSNYFKQVLDECSDSAYLFTNGDLYYYYLAYIQLTQDYKPDVKSISLNFLNTTWYPEFLSRTGVLNLGISGAELAKISNKKWKTRDISIVNSGQKGGDSAAVWSLKPTDGEYIVRSDLILKAFLEKNAFRRDVFFASDVPPNMRLFLNMDNYAELRGLTYKLMAKKNTTSLSYLENRLSSLNEISTDDATFSDNKDNIQVLNNYRFAYTAAANYALEQNMFKAAENILLFEEQKYPENLLPFFADATRKWFDGFKEKILMAAANK